MFAAYDTAEDVVQRISGTGAPDGMSLRPLLDANQTDIRAQVENLPYIAGGELHTILGRPEFYIYGWRCPCSRVGSASQPFRGRSQHNVHIVCGSRSDHCIRALEQTQ